MSAEFAKPHISVILPVYNGEQAIAGALASVRQQVEPADEIIVVDDASTDGSALAASRCPGVTVCRRPINGGPAAARNSGLRLAAGAVIAFLDADDRWPPGALSALLQPLRDDANVDIVQGWVQDIWPAYAGAPRFGYNLGSAVYRRPLFDRIGHFSEDRRTGEDAEFWLRARAAGLAVLRIERVTLFYHRKPDARADRADRFHRSLLRSVRRIHSDQRRSETE